MCQNGWDISLVVCYNINNGGNVSGQIGLLGFHTVVLGIPEMTEFKFARKIRGMEKRTFSELHVPIDKSFFNKLIVWVDVSTETKNETLYISINHLGNYHLNASQPLWNKIISFPMINLV